MQLLRFQKRSQHASNLYVETGSEAASRRLENFPSVLHTQDHKATALPETPIHQIWTQQLKETKDTHHFLHQDFADKDETMCQF